MSKLKTGGAILLLVATVPVFAFAQAPAPMGGGPMGGQTPVTAVAPLPPAGPAPYLAPKDVLDRIRDEGLNHSQVMSTVSYMTDVIGPRLTGSPALKRANEWTRDTMTKWGLQNGHLEAWGPFGRGWTLDDFSAEVVGPTKFPLMAYPKAWSPSTNGTLTADVVYLDADTEADFAKYKGQLRGKIVLISKPRDLEALFTAPGSRYTDADLTELAQPPRRGGLRGIGEPAGGPGGPGGGPVPPAPATPTAPGGPGAAPPNGTAPIPASPTAPGAPVTGGPAPANGVPGGPGPQGPRRPSLTSPRLKFLLQEGAALVVDNSFRGSGGTIFVQSASVPQDIPANATPADLRNFVQVQPYDKAAQSKLLPQMTMATENYNRLIRMLQSGEKVSMKVNIQAEYQDQDLMDYNTVAEIPGTDLKNEVVMMGGHLDSWHSGTGATDNAAGCAVAMEAARILKTLGLQPRRTIRVALWTGEEEGIFGSSAYVKQHFGEVPDAPGGQPRTLVKKPEYDTFSAYYNLDNGTGKIRGIYAQGNPAVAPIFSEWLKPFADLGATTVTPRNTGSTDHVPFDRLGLPGFQFIQDQIEYDARTHHSNQDVYDRLQADDLKQAATILAAFVYQTAMMDQKLPRKPFETQLPGRQF